MVEQAVGHAYDDEIGSGVTAMSECRWGMFRPLRTFLVVAIAALILSGNANFAKAASFRQGMNAFARQDYPAAAHRRW